jgi:hypothetical protein
MKIPVFLGVLAAGAVLARAQAEDPVVAVVEGREWRRSELERFAESLPPAQSKNFYANKKAFLQQFALTQRLAQEAQKAGLDQRDPYFFRKLYSDTVFWASAMINEHNTTTPVTNADKAKYFDEHKAEYARARVKVLYIGYTPQGVPVAPGAKQRTRDEARQLAESLAKRAKGGEDFVALVKAHSEDPESREKNGDYPELKPTDKSLPPAIKATVFSLQVGGVSDVLEQGNGYYVFRLEQLVTPELAEVNDEVVMEIQKQRFDAWMQGLQKSIAVEFKDEKYFSEAAPKP